MKSKIKASKTTPVTTTAGPSSTSEPGIAEIDFGGAVKSTTGRSSKYPLISGATVMADRVIELADKFDAVADPFKASKEELRDFALPQFFSANHGRMDAPSSMVAWGTERGVRVTFKDQYTAGDKKLLYALLTPEVSGKWFRQCWEIKIDGNKIPEGEALALITEIRAVMAKHGVESAFEVKAQILPRPNFTLKRHTEFDEATLAKIQKIVPQHISVSTKGVN